MKLRIRHLRKLLFSRTIERIVDNALEPVDAFANIQQQKALWFRESSNCLRTGENIPIFAVRLVWFLFE